MANEYKKHLEPFVTVLGVVAGIGLAGGFVEGLYAPVFGFDIPLIGYTFGAMIVGGLSLMGTRLILAKLKM